jgi:hypothetical protein
MYIKVAVILLLILFVTACNVFSDDEAIEENVSNPSYENLKTNNNGKFNAPYAVQNSGEKHVAKDLGHLAEMVEGVNGVTAVVSGIYSVVGITFDDNISATQRVRVKENVYRSLSTHPRGANTVIATKQNDIEKLKEIRAKLNDNKYADQVYEDLGILIGTLEPNESNPTRKAYPSEEELKESRMKNEFSK